VSSDSGAVALPLVIADLPDRVVWVPTNSPGAKVRRLAVPAGAVVRIARRTTSTLLGEAS
jgi:NADH-quinone oxidoreductase subunit G